jgi:hypothetical protein
MIMVDELRVWPGAKPPFHRGSCHLTTDGDIADLHAFAIRIGLHRSWFQDHAIAPHYDLTPGRRAVALLFGAVEVSARQQSRNRRKRMSDFHAIRVGTTCTYQCDGCGLKAQSRPMPPPPALGIFGLPPEWKLGINDSDGDSPVYCQDCDSAA